MAVLEVYCLGMASYLKERIIASIEVVLIILAKSLFSLWLECHFQDQEAQHISLYINPYSQTVQMQKPPTIQECRGGILADEMGMGKTIEVLSLIAKDKEEHLSVDGEKNKHSMEMEINDEYRQHCDRMSMCAVNVATAL